MIDRIIGIDPSLTNTGVATIAWPDADTAPTIALRRVASAGHLDDPWPVRHQRLHDLTSRICEDVQAGDVVAIEAPAYSQSQGSAHDRAGLWWLVYTHLTREMYASVIVVSIQARIRYALGKGSGSKDAVLAAVVRRYLDLVEVRTNDEADALLCAALVARKAGQPIESSLPAPCIAAVNRVEPLPLWVRMSGDSPFANEIGAS
jgi:Holliday junction resolvasome RuvABC endonuclease subunit